MKDWFLIILTALFVLITLTLFLLHLKKRKNLHKIKALSPQEKNTLLNHLVDPLGYLYDSQQDIFMTKLDAPQKLFGYNTFYDMAAAYFNIVFDYEAIYFDYNSRTWLIEMWKGQYGINVGCELGIYYADGIVSPADYETTHFEAVDAKDMLDISLKLNQRSPQRKKHCTQLAQQKNRHWWLTIFKMGKFAKPEDLFVNTSIRFKDYQMLNRFLDRFEESLPDTMYKINGLTVYFSFCKSSRTYSLYQKLVRGIALWNCHIFCIWFNHITGAFTNSGDKLLYLYYYLPFIVRHMLKPKKVKKK